MDGTRGLGKEVSRFWRLTQTVARYLARARDCGGRAQKRRTGAGYIRTKLGSIGYKPQLSEPGRLARVQIKLELGVCVTAGCYLHGLIMLCSRISVRILLLRAHFLIQKNITRRFCHEC